MILRSSPAPAFLVKSRPVARTLSASCTRHSSSAKLFADADAEERAEAEAQSQASGSTSTSAKKATAAQEYPNWDGEERVQDAVLRMLVDKYKPLRTGQVISSESRIKDMISRQGPVAPTRIIPSDSASKDISLSSSPPPAAGSAPSEASSSTNRASAPTSGWKDGEFYPFLVTFRPPTHAPLAPSVKYGRLPPSNASALTSSPSGPISSIEDPRARAEARRQRKIALSAGRLGKAREGVLDYRLGGSLESVTSGGAAPRLQSEEDDLDEEDTPAPGSSSSRAMSKSAFRHGNPQSMRAWNSLIEEKIERARAKGAFDNLPGRGAPLARDVAAESNPYIPRTEFLLNRMVKRQGAAPPWVGMQTELNSALATFRQSLIESWTRRVIRTLTADRPASSLSVKLDELKRHRDAEWEQTENSFHETQINSLNSQIRSYNALAPYAVRWPYLALQVELNSCYETAAENIQSELAARKHTSPGEKGLDVTMGGGGSASWWSFGSMGGSGTAASKASIWSWSWGSSSSAPAPALASGGDGTGSGWAPDVANATSSLPSTAATHHQTHYPSHPAVTPPSPPASNTDNINSSTQSKKESIPDPDRDPFLDLRWPWLMMGVWAGVPLLSYVLGFMSY